MRAVVPVLLGLLLSCGGKSTPRKPELKHLTLFVTTELRGTIEPCGCNSDPMGDLARAVHLIGEARKAKKAVLVLDGGSLLYTKPQLPEHLEAQETLKADLITRTFRDELQVAAVGLGPYDFAQGIERITPPRHAANVPADTKIPLEPPKVIDAGGVKVGVFGVVAPNALKAIGVTASDPTAAARAAVESLEADGAQVIVALAHMIRTDAQNLARKVKGIDIVVIGQNALDPPRFPQEPIAVGDTWLVQPANRGQVITRLDVSIRADGPLADAVGKARAETMIAKLDEQIPELEAELDAFKKDPDADPSFIATRERDLAELKSQKSGLSSKPLRVPESGNWFTMEQVEIKKRLPCNEAIVAAKVAYDKTSGEANVKAAAGKKPAPPKKGKPGYAGVGECEMCHDEQTEFWKKTKHFEAWETLEKVGKQYNFDCTYCHATGWDKPGGSNLAVNEHLRDIQCETCHGPGSIHVEEDGKEAPKTLIRAPEETVCIRCHNEEHSDTFDYEAYLRDVTGPGHGEQFRKKLGDGPRGFELRKAALEKAGSQIGAGCPK